VATTWGWYGLFTARLGNFRAAHEQIARARALEPASLITRIWESQILLDERRLEEAESAASGAIALDSTFLLAWQARENSLLAMGQTGQAVTMMERHVALLPPGRPEEIHGMLSYGYALAGRAREARAVLETMRAKSGGQIPATGATAAALEELGDHEAAVALLGEAIVRHDSWLETFSRWPRYDKLRKDRRVAAMLAKLETR
jgi:tetratricopeptide (TPR) repeat protein